MFEIADVSWTPDPSALPGWSTFQHLVNAVGIYALLGCLVAAIIGGVSWAFGASASNPEAAGKGQKMVVGAVVGAVVIGASSLLINFFYHLGQTIH